MEFKTIFSPRFVPKDSVLLYHYCDKFVFESICQYQELWLSDIYTMNDSTEFNYGRELFIRVLKEHIDEFELPFRLHMVGVVMSAQQNALPLIACFSRKGDLLSQWRAYANDGRGFSIGFNSYAIYRGLGVNVNSVVYNERKQYTLVLNTLRGLFAWWKGEGEDFDQIRQPSMGFSIDLAYMKNPTFFEEQEVRIIRLVTKENNAFVDGGGNSDINEIKPLAILNRTRNEQTIRYVKLPISIKNNHIIKEIVIGPKNELTIAQVEEHLADLGLKNILVKKSNSPYR